MSRYRIVREGSLIPVPGGKRIEEFFGHVHTGTERLSLARMSAPPGWTEPGQTPAFDELTIMLEGTLHVEVDGQAMTIQAGDVLLVERSAHVRYTNRSDRSAEYWAICLPAFTLDGAHRDPD